MRAASKAPAKAKIGVAKSLKRWSMEEKMGKDTRLAGNKAEETAPKAAPEDIPIMPESARGLRKKPWNTAPAAANSPPQRAASKTRGRRISRIMVDAMENSPASGLVKMAAITSWRPKFSVPRLIPQMRAATNTAMASPKDARFFTEPPRDEGAAWAKNLLAPEPIPPETISLLR